ncbi:MAG: WXG100 family type VII secretion target [Anaerolineales bacterium]|nr:WXG100 family type VII secretion target [Anaerolineales bacterium]
MPPLHLSPETAHQTAALLQRQAGALFEAAHALRRDLARLQIAWQGGQGDAFQSQGRGLCPRWRGIRVGYAAWRSRRMGRCWLRGHSMGWCGYGA